MSLIGLDHYVAGEVSTLKGLPILRLEDDQSSPAQADRETTQTGFPYHKLVF